MIRRLLPFFLCLATLLTGFSLHAQQIDSVDVEVSIRPDGSAIVCQVWRVEVVSGTEWYIPVTENDGIKISHLKVVEIAPNPEWSETAPQGTPRFVSIPFETEEGDWNTSRSLSEKAYRCGIHDTPEGCEICWGQGSMGKHLWMTFFLVEGLVQSLNDYDAFNFMFVNPELVAPPGKASVTVINKTGGPEWNEENIRFWGFGYKGSILLEDGKVVARTEEPLGTYDKMIVMMRFDKGLLSPVNTRDMDFEEMEKKAKEGSDWNDWEVIGGMLVFGGIVDACTGFSIIRALFALLAALARRIWYALGFKYKKKYFLSSRVDGYFRQPPFNGNLLETAYILKNGQTLEPRRLPAQLMSAYFLRWIFGGQVSVRAEDEKHAVLVFPAESPAFNSSIESRIYQMAREAAKSNGNLSLEKNEFKKWAKDRKYTLGKWFSDALEAGRNATSEGYSKIQQVAEFRNYLEDFTIVSEREAVEVKLWKEYLVFAALFGIADRVAKQFSKLYPKVFAEISSQACISTGALMSTINFSSQISRAVRTKEQTPVKHYSSSGSGTSYYGTSYRSSSSGRGGSSSYRGGGGYSGGGRGGGSR